MDSPVPLLHGPARIALLMRLFGAPQHGMGWVLQPTWVQLWRRGRWPQPRPGAAMAGHAKTNDMWALGPNPEDPLELVRARSPEWTWRHQWAAQWRLQPGRASTGPSLDAKPLQGEIHSTLEPRGLIAGLLHQLRAEGLGHWQVDKITLSKGQCAGLFLSPVGAKGVQNLQGVHAKVSPFNVPLNEEFARQQAAHARWGAVVPKPLAHGETPQGLRWMLSERVAHRPCTPSSLAPRGGGLHPALVSLFSPIHTPDPAPEISNAELLEQLSQGGYMQSEGPQALLTRLPHWPQHGDLWPGNMGWADKSLVVFDWEDYGRLALPGLDLYLLQASGVSVGSAAWEQVLGTLMSAQEVQALQPVYEGARRWLRRNYAPSINFDTPHLRGLPVQSSQSTAPPFPDTGGGT